MRLGRLRGRRPVAMVGVVLAAAVVLAPVLATTAVDAVGLPASDASDYTVTFVARQCQSYTDIMANKARNNIQESLRDLGKDTVYGQSEQVSVAVEDANQSPTRCTPLVGWKLQLGRNITGKSPGTANLSTVTQPYSDEITTKSSTPLLDGQGNATGTSVAGAVTIDLTADQARRAQSSSSLWVQGGRGADTLNDASFPGTYAFGALRCAIDNLNGDNVEWIGYPGSQRHVVCYYYAVKNPPPFGTIVVRKQLAPGSYGPATFTYDGNISYADSDNDGTGDFPLAIPVNGTSASATFIRAADPDDVWNFAERPEPGWVYVSLTCNDPLGGSTAVIDDAARKASVTVAPGHTLTCTYVNRHAATGPLELDKVTEGGVGSFPFTVTTPGGTNDFDGNVTTTEEGVPAVVKKVPTGDPGAYSATETLPAPTARGSWSLEAATCNGVPKTVTGTLPQRTISGTIDDSEEQICTFTNRFTPGGSITIKKETVGGTGTFGFTAQQYDDTADDFVGDTTFLRAAVTSEGVPTTATVTDGPALTQLPVASPQSTYVIRDLEPPDTQDATWVEDDLRCNAPVSEFAGGAKVTMTDAVPAVVCTFVNRKDPTALVQVGKTVSGSGKRSGSIEVVLSCTDGTHATLTGAASKPGPFHLDSPYVFRKATTCTVHETATGVASGSTVATKIGVSVNGDVTTHAARSVTFPVSLGDRITATVANVYSLADSGGGGGSGGGSGSGGSGGGGSGGSGSGGTLPVTGPNDLSRNAQLGGWLVLGGLALAFAARGWRRDVD